MSEGPKFVDGSVDNLQHQQLVAARHVSGTDFWNGTSTLKQYFVLPKNGSNYYLKYTFLAILVLGILGLGTPCSGDNLRGAGGNNIHGR